MFGHKSFDPDRNGKVSLECPLVRYIGLLATASSQRLQNSMNVVDGILVQVLVVIANKDFERKGPIVA